MGINIIDKISEFSFDTKTCRPVKISAEQLREEKCNYTFQEGENEKTFFGRMESLLDYQKKHSAILTTLDGEEQILPAKIYVVSDEQKPSDRLGVYLTSVRRIQ